ncbi:hypothetical protein ACTMQE_22390 [Escherichia coli]
MKHRHILTFFVAFLFMTIVPDSDAALVKRPEKGRAPFPEYVEFAQNRNQFPCNARLRFKGLCFVEQTDPWVQQALSESLSIPPMVKADLTLMAWLFMQ